MAGCTADVAVDLHYVPAHRLIEPEWTHPFWRHALQANQGAALVARVRVSQDADAQPLLQAGWRLLARVLAEHSARLLDPVRGRHHHACASRTGGHKKVRRGRLKNIIGCEGVGSRCMSAPEPSKPRLEDVLLHLLPHKDTIGLDKWQLILSKVEAFKVLKHTAPEHAPC